MICFCKRGGRKWFSQRKAKTSVCTGSRLFFLKRAVLDCIRDSHPQQLRCFRACDPLKYFLSNVQGGEILRLQLPIDKDFCNGWWENNDVWIFPYWENCACGRYDGIRLEARVKYFIKLWVAMISFGFERRRQLFPELVYKQTEVKWAVDLYAKCLQVYEQNEIKRCPPSGSSTYN